MPRACLSLSLKLIARGTFNMTRTIHNQHIQYTGCLLFIFGYLDRNLFRHSQYEANSYRQQGLHLEGLRPTPAQWEKFQYDAKELLKDIRFTSRGVYMNPNRESTIASLKEYDL